jgi:L-amino acid N-acyltransferase YncA
MKAPPREPEDSNAAGSEDGDGHSTEHMLLQEEDGDMGRLLRRRRPSVPEYELRGWDGNLQPPPIDWELRPRFYNNTPDFKHSFEDWLGQVVVTAVQRARPSVDWSEQRPNFAPGVFSTEEVQTLDNHPDGIGFVPRDIVVDRGNAERYGYRPDGEIAEIPRMPAADFDADAKLDLKDRENMKYKDDTAQMFIDRCMARLQQNQTQVRSLPQALPQGPQQDELVSAAAEPVSEPVAPPKPRVKTNIYLRPAVRADFPGMTKIYNWHIVNGVRPSELNEITDADMEERHHISTSAKLPVIVAVERNRKNSHKKPPTARQDNWNMNIQNFDPTYSGVVKDENVVGWASATDWSAVDYIENISVELEIYVAPTFRQKGVGRCLMDALLDATDRGHLRKGGYDFHVAPEARHLYSGGGGRDLHKTFFQLRNFSRPITPEQNYRRQRAVEASDWLKPTSHEKKPSKDFTKAARLDDREDDYAVWLKEWLESFGFEEESHLREVGCKKRRFVDLHSISRRTAWRPVENRIPDFANGL